MTRGAIAVLLALLAAGLVGPARTVPRASAGVRPSASRLANASELRRRLGLEPEYHREDGVEAVKVAVLDFGFDGLAAGRAYLPDGSVIVEHYDPDFVRRFGLGDPEFRKGFEPGNAHGRQMAQIIWAISGGRPGGPKFYLLNANGPTMLRRAVRYAIEQGVDVLLFSESFEGGGNGDGRGFINRIVDEAVGAGILWINAAGNYGGRVYDGPVRVLPDGFLRLRDRTDVAALRFRNRLDENTVTVTLTWNDYRQEEDAGTAKDLDLFVEDWAGRPLGSGLKAQVEGDEPAGPEESRNPRERVVLADLPAGPVLPADPDYTYRIRVRVKSGRFSEADRLRILLTAEHDVYLPPGIEDPREAVEFLDASGAGELFPPADHPRVLTVGDSSPGSSLGPTTDGRPKPDALVNDSRAYFTDGQVTAGSSNSAAYLAGVAVVLRAAEPGLRPRHLLQLAREGTPLPRSSIRGSARPAPRNGAPSLADRARGGTAGIRVIEPDGRVRILPALPTAPNADSARPAPASPTDLRTWKTPTRARLAEVVRAAD